MALAELEELKPVVQQKIIELNRKQAHQVNGLGQFHQNNSLHWSPVKKQTLTNYDVTKVQFLYIILVEVSISFQFAELCLGGNLDFKLQFITYSVAPCSDLFSFLSMLLLLFVSFHCYKISASICSVCFLHDRLQDQLHLNSTIRVQGLNNFHMPGLWKSNSASCK